MIHVIFKLFTLLIFSKADFEDNYPTVTELLGYKEGVVGNESFVYYYIHHSGNIILSLTSSLGDADLYISESKIFPTFYPETYDLHSATCGIELIEIPQSFKSPFAVGVYGHSAYDLSNFILEVFKSPRANQAIAIIEDELPQDVRDSLPNEEPKIKISKSKFKKKTPVMSSKLNGFFSLFEIIGLIFL